MLDKTFRNDLRHDLVGAVDALAALKPQREGDRVGKVGWAAKHPLGHPSQRG